MSENRTIPTSKNRWNVKFVGSSHICKIYANSEQEVFDLFKDEEIESITPFDDFGYVDLIETMKNHSKLIGSYSIRNGTKEIYMYPWGADCVIFRLYKDFDGGYYDIAEYQERGGQLMVPITFTYSNPTDLYEKYFKNEIEKALLDGLLSAKELKKTKAKLFSRKNGNKFWVDKDGYFYDCENYYYPNKDNKAEYNEFHDEPNAVYVKADYAAPQGSNTELKWWHSLDDFLLEFSLKIKNVPGTYGSSKYKVKKRGYKKLPPEERKVIYRYPYLNIDRQLDEGHSPEHIANIWVQMLNPKYFQSGDVFGFESHICNMVKYYQDYRSKNDVNK